MEQFDDVLYCNDGDWVENCTALIEDFSGELRLISGLELPVPSLELVYSQAA